MIITRTYGWLLVGSHYFYGFLSVGGFSLKWNSYIFFLLFTYYSVLWVTSLVPHIVMLESVLYLLSLVCFSLLWL